MFQLQHNEYDLIQFFIQPNLQSGNTVAREIMIITYTLLLYLCSDNVLCHNYFFIICPLMSFEVNQTNYYQRSVVPFDLHLKTNSV